MPTTLVRILKSGVPVAVVLAGIGYLYASVAGIYIDATGPDRAVRTGDSVARHLTATVPAAMAAWGFAVVAAFEVLLSLWRVPEPAAPPAAAVPPPPAPARRAGGLDPDVERLLNQLLEQADAARAKEAAGSVPPDQVHQEPVLEVVPVPDQR